MTEKIKSLGRSGMRTLLVSIFILMFFVGVVLFYYNMVYTRERELIIKNGETSAVQTATEFNEYLSTSLDALKMTSYTLDGMLADNKSDAEILDYLVGQSNAIMNTVFENTTGMYGYINGKFVSGSNWTPPDGFVATERPWYIKAMANPGEIVIIEPYLDAQTGNMMMALAKTLVDGKSVVAFDMTLERIQEITEQAVGSGMSDTEFIIDASGSVIAHSDVAEVGKSFGEENGSLGAEIFKELRSSRENYFEISHSALHYIVYSTKIHNDWICVSVKDTTRTFASITVILLLTIVVVIVIAGMIAGMTISSANRSIIAERLSKQLSSTADIYISLYEINFVTDTFIEVRNNKEEASKMIGETRNNCQQMIRAIMTKFSDDSTRSSILDFVDFSKLNARLKDRNTITCEFLSADNKWRRARYIVSGRLADGRVAGAMYLIEDIDAERRDSDKMHDTAKQLSSQLGSIANIYTSVHDLDIINDTFTIIKMNDSVVQNAIGNDVHNAQQVLRSAMTKLTDKSCLDDVLEFIEYDSIRKNVAETGTATVEFLNSRGSWCRGRFILSQRTDDGEISHVIWAVENIDAERRTREKLANTARELNYQISSIANIYLTAHDIDIDNDTFTEMKSDIRLVGEDLSAVHENARETLNRIMATVTDDSARARVLRFLNVDTLDKRLRNRDTIAIEFMNRDKQWRRGRFVASRRSENGRPTHVLWLTEDIDSEKQQRDKLRDMSERAIAANEAKSSFLSNMSQEIRTPLDSVLNTNEIIRRDSRDEHIIECSEKIRRDGAELLGIINDILDYSAIEAGKLKIVPAEYDLNEVIGEMKEIIQMKAAEKGLRFVTEISGNVPGKLYGDKDRFRQIVMNLLTNAVKYTRKGTVTLSVGCEEAENEPGSVMLSVVVKDTGIGMKREEIEQYYSGPDDSAGGNGIGAGITKKLLRMMDSDLEVESVYELGSKFSFELKQGTVNG